MISKAMCQCVFIIVVQLLIWKTMAYKKTSNVNEYMEEDQRTHKRQNYILQKDMENEILDNVDDMGPSYAMSSFEPDSSNSEELPAMIVDYANMIRNDIILLDNSVETRTRKRANKDTIDLDRHEYFPTVLETKKCSQKLCSKLHRCESIEYKVTVVRKRRAGDPHQGVLNTRLVSETQNVTVACLCVKEGQ